MGGGDVAPFHRFARLYDLCMYRADVGPIERGLALAERSVDCVLDVGGGTGRVSRALDGYDVSVVDAARGMLRRARAHGLATVQGDARRLPVGDASADAVIVVDALHHMADPDAVFAEARRVLRPRGVVVVREFDPTTVRGRALVALEHFVGFEPHFFPPDDLAARIERAGFVATVPDRGFGYTVVGLTGERTSQVGASPGGT